MKKFFAFLFICIMGILSCLPAGANVINLALATSSSSSEELYTGTFSQTFAEDNIKIDLTYTELGLPKILDKEVTIELTQEKDEETLKKFHKYVKKKIDSADIGFVFYCTTTFDGQTENLPNATYNFVVTIPKNLRNKELAVIPFKDYRTTTTTIPVVPDANGIISFSGTEKHYAYAIVYNGVYKDLILIGVILVILLVICVLVKIYTVRKDNPIYLEKKKDKATKQAKEAHKQNKKLQQALKRQKEKEKQERLKNKKM